MRSATLILLGCVLPAFALAAGPDFTGTWTIDLRTKAERKRKLECGVAAFELAQSGDLITGDHTFSTVGCGRLNEGGPETVKGVVVGNTAILVVTSGRNGAIVMGKATRSQDRLRWVTLQEVKPSETPGDSPLILGSGTLIRER